MNVKDLILSYSKVYEEFEKLQNGKDSILPGGDQKTGVIGEYYAKCYIENHFKVQVDYAKSGESYDLIYKLNEENVKIQVKCVSCYSKTRIIAPLNLNLNKNGEKPFDELYLISLNRQFIPDGFYINDYTSIKGRVNDRTKIKGSVMKGKTSEGRFRIGSSYYDFKEDKLKLLIEVLDLI